MYTPKYVKEYDLRHFFTPPLDYEDLHTTDLLLKIESVEDFVEAVYFQDTTTTAANARIPCLLLIASKIISSTPELAQKYGTISKETLGDYSYELADLVSGDESISPNTIAKTWEKMAIEMLENRSYITGDKMKWGLWKAND